MNESKAARYQRLQRRSRVAQVAATFAALGVMALTPLADWLASAATRAAGGTSSAGAWTLAVVLFAAAVVAVVEIAMLPASLYATLHVDGRYRGNVSSVEQVLWAHVQAFLVVLPVACVVSFVVIASVDAVADAWWMIVGPFMGFGLLAALQATPLLLAGMATTGPVPREGLKARLLALAIRAGVEVGEIVEWRVGAGPGTTALVAGLGRPRQILLASALAREWSEDEVAVVVAHELGHLARGDLWRSWLLDALVLWAACLPADALVRWRGLSPGSLAALPLIALVVLAVWTTATPLRRAQSRAQERRADQFALQLTGETEAFARALRRLGSEHLVEEYPSDWTRWIFHRHPTVSERLRAARSDAP